MPAVQDSINAIRVAAEAADRIKATDIVAFDVADLLGITDIMMIAGASNERGRGNREGSLPQVRWPSAAFARRSDRGAVGIAGLWRLRDSRHA